MPKITGNWYAGSNHPIRRDELSGKKFFQWVKEHSYTIYSYPKFAVLTGNKLAIYNAVKAFDKTMVPLTEPWDNSIKQLEKFMSQAKKIYIKPIYGKEGNEICTIRSNNGFTLTHFMDKNKEKSQYSDLNSINEKLSELCTTDDYIIQQGIDNQRFPYPFSLRIIMVNNGERWHNIHWIIAANSITDVSNLY